MSNVGAMKGKAMFHNEDCTNFFYCHDCTGGKAGAVIDAYIDVLAEAGVTTLLCNTNAQLTNYASEVWEPFWKGFDPSGPDDQPYLAGIQQGIEVVPVDAWRRMVTNMLAMHSQRIDYPARVAERCRRHGISPWITLRMNDVHCGDNPRHPIHSSFWRNNARFFRQGYDGYFATAFDYAHAGVRHHYRLLIEESLRRYDIDGLELDFLREPYLFSRGQEAAGRHMLTDWIGEIRELVDEYADQRGHPILLGVRTPSRADTSLALGLDPVEWARRDLVDMVVVTPRWSTLEYDMPIEEWGRMLEGCEVLLAGGLEVNVAAYPGARQRSLTPEEAIGAAVQVMHGGADSVYLFNYFQDRHPGWPRDQYVQTLRTLASVDALFTSPRRHVITFRDIVSPDGSDAHRPQLPAEGKNISLTLPTGPRPADDWRAELTIVLEGDTPAPAPAARMNASAPLAVTADERAGVERRIRYEVPVGVLDDETNRIEIQSSDPVKVTWLDVRVTP